MRPTYKVLIIDDESAEVLAFALKKCPGSEDIAFETATDGAKGLTMATELSPALILLDIDLPVIDGFKILSELQKREVRTRVIMISGSRTDLTTAIECVRAGACDYVLKQNMEPAFLLGRIRRALILDNTINVPLAELPASSQLLIEEARRLKEKYEGLKKENQDLKEANEVLVKKSKAGEYSLVLSVAHKVLSVLLAISCPLLLKHFKVVESSAALLAVFLVPLILLLIPAQNIQSISASVQRLFTANIALNKNQPEDKNSN